MNNKNSPAGALQSKTKKLERESLGVNLRDQDSNKKYQILSDTVQRLLTDGEEIKIDEKDAAAFFFRKLGHYLLSRNLLNHVNEDGLNPKLKEEFKELSKRIDVSVFCCVTNYFLKKKNEVEIGVDETLKDFLDEMNNFRRKLSHIRGFSHMPTSGVDFIQVFENSSKKIKKLFFKVMEFCLKFFDVKKSYNSEVCIVIFGLFPTNLTFAGSNFIMDHLIFLKPTSDKKIEKYELLSQLANILIMSLWDLNLGYGIEKMNKKLDSPYQEIVTKLSNYAHQRHVRLISGNQDFWSQDCDFATKLLSSSCMNVSSGLFADFHNSLYLRGGRFEPECFDSLISSINSRISKIDDVVASLKQSDLIEICISDLQSIFENGFQLTVDVIFIAWLLKKISDIPQENTFQNVLGCLREILSEDKEPIDNLDRTLRETMRNFLSVNMEERREYYFMDSYEKNIFLGRLKDLSGFFKQILKTFTKLISSNLEHNHFGLK